MRIVLVAAFIVLVGIWVSQLVSGKLVGQKFKVFKTREQAPIYFGATLALEGSFFLRECYTSWGHLSDQGAKSVIFHLRRSKESSMKKWTRSLTAPPKLPAVEVS